MLNLFTKFLDTTLKVRNTSTSDDPEDGSRTGGWMWPASFVMLRFLEEFFAPHARLDLANSRKVERFPLDSVLQMPGGRLPRSILDFSAGPGLIGIAASCYENNPQSDRRCGVSSWFVHQPTLEMLKLNSFEAIANIMEFARLCLIYSGVNLVKSL